MIILIYKWHRKRTRFLIYRHLLQLFRDQVELRVRLSLRALHLTKRSDYFPAAAAAAAAALRSSSA
jgi:hypothetical protein